MVAELLKGGKTASLYGGALRSPRAAYQSNAQNGCTGVGVLDALSEHGSTCRANQGQLTNAMLVRAKPQAEAPIKLSGMAAQSDE